MKGYSEHYAILNPEQRKAVDTIEGPVLVVAGPGTGKTQVLALRIVNILKQTDTDSKSILCLTFQDASVTAMKNRLAEFIGDEAYKLKIHTFHSFCNDVIRTFPNEFGFSGNVETIKDIDKLGVFKEILEEKKLTKLQIRNDILGYFKQLEKAISNLKKEFVNPDKLSKLISVYGNSLDEKYIKLEESKIEKMQQLQIFYKSYLQILEERNLIDFDDMIFKVTEKFATNEQFVSYFQEQYLYTLVDEFQDTNSSQLEIIKAIAYYENITSNVFVVGDDDQTIFRFQGASSNNLTKFLEIFPDTTTITLQTNYRSVQEIVSKSKKLIKNNWDTNTSTETNIFIKDYNAFKQKKEQNQNRKVEPTVQVHEFMHSYHEDYWIGTKIRELIDVYNVEAKEIAVIARTNAQINNITKVLDAKNISYEIKRSASVLEDKNIIFLVQLLETISNPNLLKNDILLWQILSHDVFGFNYLDIFRIYQESREAGVNLSSKKIENHHDLEGLNSSSTNSFHQQESESHPNKTSRKNRKDKFLNYILNSPDDFTKQVKQVVEKLIYLQGVSQNTSFKDLFGYLLKEIRFISYVEQQELSFAELNKLSSLFQYINTRSKFLKNYSLDTFLQEVKIMQEKNIILPMDPIDLDEKNKIKLITAHGAKGLEYEHVFIYQSIEDKWEKNFGSRNELPLPPLTMTEEVPVDIIKQLNDLEKEIDERRLFYVAMTRAKENLYMTYSKKYYESDSGEVETKEKNISRFVLETKTDFIETHEDLVQKHTEILQQLVNIQTEVNIDQDNKKYLKKYLEKNLTISASGLNKYNKCHYKFLLEDVFKLPTVQGISLQIGTIIHETIDYMLKEFAKGQKFNYSPKLETIIKKGNELFSQNVESISLDENTSIEKAKEEVSIGIEAYYKYFINNKSLPHYPLIEKTFFGSYNKIRLVGRIDKISNLKLNNLEKPSKGLYEQTQHKKYEFQIVDYKTCSRVPSINEFLGFTKGSDKSHLKQLLFYKLILENTTDHNLREYYKNLESLQLEYIDTKLGEVVPYTLPISGIYEYKPRKNSKNFEQFDIDAEYENLKQEILNTYKSIMNLNFDKTANLKECELCPFKTHCGR